MVVYFGEDPDRVDAGEFFSTFANFITKFEVLDDLSLSLPYLLHLLSRNV